MNASDWGALGNLLWDAYSSKLKDLWMTRTEPETSGGYYHSSGEARRSKADAIDEDVVLLWRAWNICRSQQVREQISHPFLQDSTPSVEDLDMLLKEINKLRMRARMREAVSTADKLKSVK